MNKLYKRLYILSLLLLSCLFLLTMGMISSVNAKGESLEHIKVIMDWYPYAESYAPFLIARDKGYFKEEGLEVELVPGAGSAVSTKLVANKEDDFGIADATTTLIARTKGAPLVVLAVLNQSSPVGVFSLKEANITKPNDLIGKRVSSDIKSKKHNQFLGFLKKNNIDPNQITFVPVTGGGEPQAMLSGQADACLGVFGKASTALKKVGKDCNIMLLEDYGLHIYDRAIITHEDMLKKNPKVARGFIRASLKGLRYALDHPEEAIDIYIRYYPEGADREIEIMMFKGISRFIESEVTTKYGLGYQILQRWENTQDFSFEGGLIDKKIDVREIYTNKFR